MDENLQCPWDGFAPATMSFCERRLCDWIVEPANTWTNLAYLVVGLVVIWRARKEKAGILEAIGWIAIILCFGSFAFHGTATFVGEVADLSAMFLFSNFALCFNLWRYRDTPIRKLYMIYAALTALAITLMIVMKTVGIALFVLLIVITGVLELLIRLHKPGKIHYRYLFLLCGFFAVAFAIWILDKRGIVCDPDNHFLQGHAAWHLINPFCFYFLFRFYQQFLPFRNRT